MKRSLFYKSCQKDFDWLKFSRDSVRKFCSGFDEIVLCLPEGQSFDWPEAKIVHVREDFTGYCFQQAVKLYADTWCSGDFITYQDSDTVFSRPMDAGELFRGDKPIWILRPYGEARSDQQVWRKPTEDFMGETVEFEGMYRHPMTTSRLALQKMRGFCQFKHGVSMDEYIRRIADNSRPLALSFSEFNALSAFSKRHCPEEFHWIDASKEEPPPACTWQGYSHGGEARKQEDIAKFKELLEGNPEEGDIASEVVPSEEKTESVAGKHDLTVPSAIAFLAASVKNNIEKARIIKQIKKAWAPPRKAKYPKKDEWLLCIHSYPGANETVERHWDNFLLSGATRIVGVGTLDGGCAWPEGCDAITLGRNAYLKFKGEDDNLCRRLMDTVQWCLDQPEDKFVICEYDVLFLKRFPPFNGVSACKTGGRVNGSKASQFFHGPWCFDRRSAGTLIDAMAAVLPDSQSYPNNSPDLFFGLACERASIPVTSNFTMFTRNTLDHDLELACEAVRGGVDVIHGCKTKEQFEAIMNATRPVVSQ